MEISPLTPEFKEHLSSAFNSEINPVKYLAIDPGKINGVCGYDAKYYLNFMYSIPETDMPIFLELFNYVDKCIVENFLLYPNKALQQTYSSMVTSRVIGRIEHWASVKNIELIKQNATIKKTGYAWIGQKPPSKSNPRNHELDANVHFIYWAVKNRKIDAADLIRNRR